MVCCISSFKNKENHIRVTKININYKIEKNQNNIELIVNKYYHIFEYKFLFYPLILS